MATPGWGTDRPLEDLLFAEGWRFEFFQAARLLERLYPERVPPGEGSDPAAETVSFRSRVGLDFPATEIASITPADGGPAAMTVNFLGLAGVLGPLPPPVTELVMQAAWKRDRAPADFLDLFNHRLVSLLLRAKKAFRPAHEWETPDHDDFADCAFALLGLLTEGLRDRLGVPDRALLAYTGLLAQRPRSMVALERVLAAHFGVAVRSRQTVGKWLALEEDDRTVLGRTGRNQRLGRGAVLGGKVWEQAAGVELRLGPLGLPRFLDFLPIGRAFRALAGIVRLHAGPHVDVTVRLALVHDEVPLCRLGCGPRLGWTSWLGRPARSVDDEQVVVRLGAAADPPRAEGGPA